ncbi:Uncharacterised protein [Yersinia pseudotuberculosis]|uniref:hypothetical protein n=1 Tax=Yersinia pseudotuberculosis TaxID=633 RepID=UPI0005EA483C|nr:hypothetical protein [Yersinia pseudotuberculosis]CNK48553.1 Uncharacterised protein [Yersinia pseudotuberculosis]
MSTKPIYLNQPAMILIPDVSPIHGSFNIKLIITEENQISGAKKISISALGKTNLIKALGSGKVRFWCVIYDVKSNKKYTMDRKKGESWAIDMDSIPIGNTTFIIPFANKSTPSITVEAGYLYEDYSSGAAPMPKSTKKEIKLTPFRPEVKK